MRALFISNDASIPDVASATRARMQAYAEVIGEMHVLLRADKTRTTTDGAITIHEVRAAKWLAPFMLPRHARAIIKKYDIEIVSAQDPFEHGLAALLAVRGSRVRLHIQVHTDFLSPWFTNGYSRLALLNHVRLVFADIVLPHAHGIRVVAPRIARSLIARYGSRINEPTVIPVSVHSGESEKSLEPPFPCTLLAVSRLEPEKRLRDVLRALAVVRRTHLDVGLVIAGSGREHARLHREAVAQGVLDHVRFLGARADVQALMKAAHIFVQASAYEGYGMTLIEAACANLPIVTTDVGIVGDVLASNVHVLTAHAGDVVGLAAQITRLVEDSALATSLSLAAHQAATEHLSAYTDQPRMIADDLAHTIAV